MKLFVPWLQKSLLTLPLLLGATALASSSSAQEIVRLTTLHQNTTPASGLILARDGNLYGTNPGTIGEFGAVFRLTPEGVLTTLYVFPTDGSKGAGPESPLLEAADGSFYGVTDRGGANGVGTVFRVTREGALTSLYSFPGGRAGRPNNGLILGADGYLYGTTYGVPPSFAEQGVVYRLTAAGEFSVFFEVGGIPARLLQGTDGALYGTKYTVEHGGEGDVYRLLLPGGNFQGLHYFGFDGTGVLPYPVSGLVEGGAGMFYGTLYQGGDHGVGAVYRVQSDSSFTTLYSFTGGQDGARPVSELVQGGNGDFYGTTAAGGAGDGTLFRVTPAGALTTLYTFAADEGSAPAAALIRSDDGGFYGVTTRGGVNGYGTIFKLTFDTAPSRFFAGEVPVGDNVYYLSLNGGGSVFGYYAFLSDPHYLYHFDLGYEYVFDANDGQNGVYLYDFASGSYFYTSPSFPFPYLYDFSRGAVLYYFPDPNQPGRYTSTPRYFYDFSVREIISK